MGLSSSQARLLTLTGRMHDIEYKAQKLEAQKLQMANESRRVYEDYLIALDAAKIQMKTMNTDGSLNYVDATYNMLVANGYKLEFDPRAGIDNNKVGKIEVTQNDIDLYSRVSSDTTATSDGARDYFAAIKTNRINCGGYNAETGTYEIYTANQLINNNRPTEYKHYSLMADLDLSGIAPGHNNGYINLWYGETFNGNGHTISNASYAIFGDIANSTVENLRISNSNIDTDSYSNITDSSWRPGNSVGVLTNGAYTTNVYDNGTHIANIIVENCTIISQEEFYTGADGLVGVWQDGATIGGVEYSPFNEEIIEGCGGYNVEHLAIGGETLTQITTLSGSDIENARKIYNAISSGNYYMPGEDPDEEEFVDPTVKFGDNSYWLANMVNEGFLHIYKKGVGGDYYQTSVATDTDLQEVQDKTLLRKAEAKYEADMKAIDLKDRKYDTDLAALESERDAIKQEIETLKTVARDNVERTFRLFG